MVGDTHITKDQLDQLVTFQVNSAKVAKQKIPAAGTAAYKTEVVDPILQRMITNAQVENIAKELGVEVVVVRGAKLTVSPLRMDSAQVREMKQRVPQAIYSVAAREVSSKLELQPNSNGRPNMREGLEVLAAIIESRRRTAA